MKSRCSIEEREWPKTALSRHKTALFPVPRVPYPGGERHRKPVMLVLRRIVLAAILPPCLSAVIVSAARAQKVPSGGLVVVTYPTVEPNRLPSTGPFSVPFYVKDIDTVAKLAITNSCLHSGPITCGTVNPTDIARINPGDSVLVTVTYSTTSSTGAGSIGLLATPDVGLSANKSRTVAVANAGKAWPKSANHSDDNVDRGLCLTVGAGEA